MPRIDRPAFVAAVLLLAVSTSTARPDDGPAAPRPTTVFLVGDSTVKNGRGDGSNRLWGWGNFLADHLDPARARVENRALGGRSSRT